MRTALAVVFAALLFTTPGRAEVVVVETMTNSGKEVDFQRARASLAEANEAFGTGDTTNALNHAESAYRAYPNASTALLMATIYERTDRSKAAFRWLLVARNSRPTEAQLVAVTAGLKKHGLVVGLGVLRVVAMSGELSVAGKAVPIGRWVGVSSGRHLCLVTQEGFSPLETEVVIAAGETLSLPISLSPDAPSSIVLPVALVIGGAVLLGTGAGLHVWGLGADEDLQSRNGRWTGAGLSSAQARAEHAQLTDQANTGTIAAYVLYGVGAVTLVSGALLWALGDEPSKGQGSADIVVTPTMGSGSAGLSLQGAF